MTLQRALSLIAGLALAVVAISVSLVAVAVLAVLGSAVFAYYWWKTRDLRRALREELAAAQAARAATADTTANNGIIIDGEWQRHGEAAGHAVLPAPTFAADEARPAKPGTTSGV